MSATVGMKITTQEGFIEYDMDGLEIITAHTGRQLVEFKRGGFDISDIKRVELAGDESYITITMESPGVNIYLDIEGQKGLPVRSVNGNTFASNKLLWQRLWDIRKAKGVDSEASSGSRA